MQRKNHRTADLPSAAAYNKRLSQTCVVLTLAVTLILVLYAGASILGNPDMISYESLYYMLNDFNIAAVSVGRSYTTLQYGYSFGENQVFDSYRDGLVVLNENTLTAFSSSGRRTLYERISLTRPALCTSGMYIAAYEKGGEALYLYNSFSCLFTDADLGLGGIDNDYKIADVSLSDNGSIAVALNVGASQTSVLLFNSRGKLIAEYNLPRLTVDVSLNADASMIAMASIDVSTDMGKPVTEILIYQTGELAPTASVSYGGTTPVSATFNANSDYVCALTDSVVGYDRGNDSFRRTPFNTDDELSELVLNEHGCVAYFTSPTDRDKFSVKVFDKTGNMVYNVSEDDTARLAYHTYVINNGRVFCCDANGVTVVSVESGAAQRINCPIPQDGTSVTVLSEDGTVFAVCGGSEATRYELK